LSLRKMQVLYRKYRPRAFEEIEGQEHIVRTLQGALASENVGHAYLFCGPRGTGKTTMARLLAKSLNCGKYQKRAEGQLQNIPCNSCHSCSEINEGRSLDLIEIDAASNRGIDEIRNLKDSARVAAAGGGRKIFIVDECHMLTKEANNALLKLLEEPPQHVFFVLATTEPYKIPDTILSRVQRLDFKKISPEQIKNKLTGIAKKEKININEPALVQLANSASGSLRDAESAFSKVIAYAGQGKAINLETVTEILGIVPLQVHDALINLILSKNAQEAISQINDLHEAGIDLNNFLKQFIRHLRAKLIGMIGEKSYVVVASATPGQATPDVLINMLNVFMRAANEIKLSPVPQLPIELAILELTK